MDGLIEPGLAARLAAGPISSGVCDLPGCGRQLTPDVVRALAASAYERRLVLEQDLAITGSEPPAGGGPVLDVRKSIEFLSTRAPEEEVIKR